MKKILIIILLLSLPVVTSTHTAPIMIMADPVYPYGITDRTLYAFALFESNFNPAAVNPYTGARGLLQILPPMIDEANRIARLRGLPHHYTWDDAWEPRYSIEIWHLVMSERNPEGDLAKAVQIWFGIGVQYDYMTWREYLEGINFLLRENFEM